MRSVNWLITAVFVGFAGMLLINRFFVSTAPTPPVFALASEDGSTLTSLDEALDMSASTGKPVVALATADWCGPCQALKRGALSDERVADLIAENAIPVYLEQGDNPEDIARLGVRSFPTTLVLTREGVIDRLPNRVGTSRYLSFLEDAFARAGTATQERRPVAISEYDAHGPVEIERFDADEFGYQTSLAAATRLSEETGKPMYVLATADWCVPCQHLKHNTLAEDDIRAWLDENTVKVYLEETVAADDLRRLPVRTFPTSFLIDGETILGANEGFLPPEVFAEFLDWAQAKVAAADE